MQHSPTLTKQRIHAAFSGRRAREEGRPFTPHLDPECADLDFEGGPGLADDYWAGWLAAHIDALKATSGYVVTLTSEGLIRTSNHSTFREARDIALRYAEDILEWGGPYGDVSTLGTEDSFNFKFEWIDGRTEEVSVVPGPIWGAEMASRILGSRQSCKSR